MSIQQVGLYWFYTDHFCYVDNLHFTVSHVSWSPPKTEIVYKLFSLPLSIILWMTKWKVRGAKSNSPTIILLIDGRNNILYQLIWYPIFIHQCGILSPLFPLLASTCLNITIRYWIHVGDKGSNFSHQCTSRNLLTSFNLSWNLSKVICWWLTRLIL